MGDLDEVTYGLNPLVNDAAGDLDGDGAWNSLELAEGTDPSDPFDTCDIPVSKDSGTKGGCVPGAGSSAGLLFLLVFLFVGRASLPVIRILIRQI